MGQKTKVICIFEAFVGIGTQNKVIKNIRECTNSAFKIVKTSEWDARTIMACSQIHEDVKKGDIKKIDNYLLSKTFSLDSKKPSKICRKPSHLIATNKVLNNYPDIWNVKR